MMMRSDPPDLGLVSSLRPFRESRCAATKPTSPRREQPALRAERYRPCRAASSCLFRPEDVASFRIRVGYGTRMPGSGLV